MGDGDEFDSGDDLFDGAEAEAVLSQATPVKAAPAPSSRLSLSPPKRKFENYDDDEGFDELFEDEFSALASKKPRTDFGAGDSNTRIADVARKVLRERFGLAAFRLEQETAVCSILQGRNAMVVMPTGGGKSLCYQVPALAFEELDKLSTTRSCGDHGITIVVSPLLALMKDQVDVLKRKGIPAESIDSTKTWEQQQAISAQMRNGTLRLLYCAPERLNNEGFIENLKHVVGGVRLVAVDEAHCISEWGHQFRPDYLKVARFVREIKAERAICLTATATSRVIDDVCNAFGIAKADVFRTPPYRPNLTLRAQSVQRAEDKLPLLLGFLNEHKGPTLIYVTAQQQAMDLAKALVDTGLRARPFHAGMKTEEKQLNQDMFMSDKTDIIVATIAFGMGIDKPNLRNIVHYAIPGSVEEYSQQIGRAGRDGQPSTCMFYVCPEDLVVRSVLAYGDTPTRKAVLSLLNDVFDSEVTSLPKNGVFKRSHYAQTNDYDIRANPLGVIYAVLELRFGLIRAITPEYGEYKFKPEARYASTVSRDHSPAMKAIVQHASKKPNGTIYNVDIKNASQSTGINRQDIIRKLNELHDRGVIKLTASGMEHRYRVLTDELPRTPAQIGALADKLVTDLQQREADAVRRINQVVELVTGARCFALALALHFDTDLPDGKEKCGHCGFCETGKAVQMPLPPPRRLPSEELLMDLLNLVPDRDDPRLLTRIAFGIVSPRVTRMKIGRDPVFGSLQGHDFNEVLSRFTEVCEREGKNSQPESGLAKRSGDRKGK